MVYALIDLAVLVRWLPSRPQQAWQWLGLVASSFVAVGFCGCGVLWLSSSGSKGLSSIVFGFGGFRFMDLEVGLIRFNCSG